MSGVECAIWMSEMVGLSGLFRCQGLRRLFRCQGRKPNNMEMKD